MSSEVLAYAGCGFVIVVYTWLRTTTSLGLVFLILVYQMLGAAICFESPVAEHHGGVMVPSTIAHLQLVTQALCCLLVRRAVADSAPNVSPSFSGFVVKSFAAVLIGIGISLIVRAAAGDPLADAGHDLRSIVIGLPPCLAAAFFRDHRRVDRRLPTWLRCAEACGSTMTMALGLLVLYLGQLVSLPIDALHGWRLGVTMTFPASLSIVIAACVPYIDRAEFRGPSAAPGWLVRHQEGLLPGFGHRPHQQYQDVPEHEPRHDDLGHQECHLTAMADDLCADLDQLLPQARQ